jgi:hypothetical protein
LYFFFSLRGLFSSRRGVRKIIRGSEKKIDEKIHLRGVRREKGRPMVGERS